MRLSALWPRLFQDHRPIESYRMKLLTHLFLCFDWYPSERDLCMQIAYAHISSSGE